MDKESNRTWHIRVYASLYGVALLEGNALSGSQMCIVTGPRIELAIALIQRMKALFRSRAISSSNLLTFDTKETVIELNGVKVEAFPSHHLDACMARIIYIKIS